MKIAYISPDPKSEKAISTLSNYLVCELKKKGIFIDNINYIAGSTTSFLKIIPLLKNYDILHIQHEYNLLGKKGLPFFIVFPLLYFLHKKIIISMHTVLSNRKRIDKNLVKSFFRRVLYFFQNRLINHISNKVIVNEEFFRNILIEEYGFKKSKIDIIPQAVTPNPFLINKSRAKKELGLKGNVFLIIGNLTEDVGADILIKQADKIGKTIVFATNPKGVNIRNKNKTQKYVNLNKEIVKDNHFEKFVRFDLKEIPNELWWRYFSAADLILQAYRGGIRSGVFSDAMVSKTPVIASNIPFFREMAKKYNSIKIAKKEEDYPKIIKKAMQKKNYPLMVNGCERYVKENNINLVSEKYKKLYFSLS